MTRLEQVRETKKNGKKEFPFLTPVMDYVDKNYSDIKEELDSELYEDILAEIKEKSSLVTITKDELLLIAKASQYTSVNEILDENRKGTGEYSVSDTFIRESVIRESADSWTNSYQKVNLKDLYYVSNYDSFSNYLLAADEVEKAEKLDEIEKRYAKQAEETTALFKDIQEFGITIDLNEVERLRNARKLTEGKMTVKEMADYMENMKEEILDEACDTCGW